MKQLRFKFNVFLGFFTEFFYFIPKAEYYIHHYPEKYSQQDLYKLALKIVNYQRMLGLTTTEYYGRENLPQDGGYIMYSNHQGKYDALGILLGHKHKPISILWAKRSASMLLTSQVSRLLLCQIIDKDDPSTFLPSIRNITQQVLAGKPYLIFPEGGYSDNKNTLQEFQTGCFMASIQSKTPVIPVCIYDSWKSMDTNKLWGRVKTQVHFLQPILYEEYKDLNRKQLCALVKERIQDKINQIESA